jgi:mannose-6-phosphate isomerase-like protein (cupin superfamily)
LVADRVLGMADLDVAFARLDPDNAGVRQPLRKDLGVEAFGIGLMVLQPLQQLRVHTHDRQEEVYLVLSGELTLIVEGNDHLLGAGELARVGPGVRRQLVNRGSYRVEVLALGAAGQHEGLDGRAWTSWDEGGEGRSPQDIPMPDDLPS